MSRVLTRARLAIDGGKPVRRKPIPARALIGAPERRAALSVIDRAIRTGEAFGYNGPFEERYERDFARFMGGGFADGVNSGTNAVYVALGALQLDAFSEVIVPPITDPGGVMPVPLLACIPVFADAAPGSYNTSAGQIAERITRRTRAIVVAHIAGEPVDMAPVMKLARQHKLSVIEDCAQSHGARCRGRLVGTYGDLAAFSTMFGKHHCTGGQGGVVYSRAEQLHWRAKRFADRGKPFGLEGETGNVVAGLNCNLNDLSAAIGSAQLRRLPGIVARRQRIGEAIRAGLIGRAAVSLAPLAPRTEGVYWFLRVRVDPDRLRVPKAVFCRALSAEGIPLNADYRHMQFERPWHRDAAVFGRSGFPWSGAGKGKAGWPRSFPVPNAIRAVETHFNVAMHERYGQTEIRDILDALEKVERAYLR